MIFSYKIFVEDLRQNSDKKEIISKYEELYGTIKGEIIDQIWFKDYVSKFLPYYEAVKNPEELKNDFDWQLLFALIASSTFIDLELEKPDKIIKDPEDQVDLIINVTSKSQTVSKKLSELRGFQILRLFEVCCESQLELQILIAEDGKEMIGIYEARIKKLKFIQNYTPLFRRLNPENKGNSTNLIYHYTSLNTINEILKSNSLRACDLKRLNDRREYKIWFEVFEQAVDKFHEKKDVAKYEDFLKRIKAEIDTFKSIDCYVTCFSQERDLLSQWRAYGDDGQGICISFELRELLKDLYQFNDPDSDFKLLHGPLEYNYEKVYNDIYIKIEELIHDYLISNISLEQYFNRIDKNNFFKDKSKRIYMRIQDLKDSSFFEEKEFRLFYQILNDVKDKEISTFERNKRIIPFVSLEFGDKKIPIKEIILGPSLSDKEDKKENIIEVLKHFGYNTNEIKIHNSELPYRK